MWPSWFIYFPEVVICVPIVAVPVSGSVFDTIAVWLPDVVIVSPTTNSLVVAVYFNRGAL